MSNFLIKYFEIFRCLGHSKLWVDMLFKIQLRYKIHCKLFASLEYDSTREEHGESGRRVHLTLQRLVSKKRSYILK